MRSTRSTGYQGTPDFPAVPPILISTRHTVPPTMATLKKACDIEETDEGHELSVSHPNATMCVTTSAVLSPSHAHKIRSTTRNQQQSPLLRLPGELRNRIYEYALKGFELRPLYPADFARCVLSALYITSTRRLMSAPHFCALTRVCWQIYAETKALPFALNELVAKPHQFLHHAKLGHFDARKIRHVRLLASAQDLEASDNGRYYLDDECISGVRQIKEMCQQESLKVVIMVRTNMSWFATDFMEAARDAFNDEKEAESLSVRIELEPIPMSRVKSEW